MRRDVTSAALSGASAIQDLLHLLPASSHPSAAAAAAKRLQAIPSAVSALASDALALRDLCVDYQDSFVPLVLSAHHAQAQASAVAFSSFSATSTSASASSPPPPPDHPREIAVRFHGLREALERFCRDAGCRGFIASPDTCGHRIAERLPENMVATMVHPGPRWEDFKRMLFVAVMLATELRGEAFVLGDMATVRARGGEGEEEEEEEEEEGVEVDEGRWRKVATVTTELDVYWNIADRRPPTRRAEKRTAVAASGVTPGRLSGRIMPSRLPRPVKKAEGSPSNRRTTL